MINTKASVKKILQALFYIQSNAPVDNNRRRDVMYFIKLILFADRYHIRHYGILASDDKYFAMIRGPVASTTLDVLQQKHTENIDENEIPLLDNVEQVSEYEVYIKPQQFDKLSESFKKALDFSISTYGNFNQWQLSEISHDYPEWKKHEVALSGGCKRIPMKSVDFLDNPDSLPYSNKHSIMEDPFKEDSAFLSAMREEINADATSL